MVCVKSSRVLSSWLGLSSAVLIPALAAVAHLHAQTSQPSAAPAATVIVNARIIDGSGNAPFEGTVVIKGDRIAEEFKAIVEDYVRRTYAPAAAAPATAD